MNQKLFPVSESSFAELVKKENGQHMYHFVDKTLFIKEILEKPRRISSITRPRRFGKSINFNMLGWFFDIRKKEVSQKLFEGLKIESAKLNNGKSCMDYRGKYPVISMNFKTLGQNNYEEFLGMFRNLVSTLYLTHDYLLDNDKLKKTEKTMFEKIMGKQADNDDYETALKKLMNYLHRYFGERVVILIDEYDTPFQQAIHQRLKAKPKQKSADESDYFDALKTMMGTFLGDSLKDNEDLETCVMTGIIRIAGAGIFSQLNNIDVWTVLDEPFSEFFGFTQEELDKLLLETGKIAESKKFADWYNGYEFGGKIIYNPLSVIKSLDRNKFGSYWLDTSNNMLIRDSLLEPRDECDQLEINEAVATWVSGKAIEKSVGEHLIFDSNINALEHLWVLLISSGYLKVTSQNIDLPSNKIDCFLKIPNQEVLCLYRDIFTVWLNDLGVSEHSSLIQHLLRGEAESFCKQLQEFFKAVVSVREGSKKQVKTQGDDKYEAFYHGFMVGMLGLSMNKSNAILDSNRESGYGYYDLMLAPRDPNDSLYNKAVIFEFKRAREDEDIGKAAETALNQIIEKEYQTNIVERGVKKVVFIGFAFRGKLTSFCHKTYSTDRLKIKKMDDQQASLMMTFLTH